jgi:hypothetical protein
VEGPHHTTHLPNVRVGSGAVKCLETRRTGCLTMRRYKKENGRRVKTMEMPWTLWLRVRPTVMKGVPGFETTEAARDRIQRVRQMLADGEKHEYIAAVLGITRQRVGQIRSTTTKKDT